MSSNDAKITATTDTLDNKNAKSTATLAAKTDSVGSEQVPTENLLFGVPKKGRLADKVVKLLQGIGVQYRRRARLDIAHSSNMNISLVFLPAKDIATFVAFGHVDLGITGEDIIAESGVEPKVILETKLQMGNCRLCLQAPAALVNKPASYFAGKRIVTSFPNLAAKFFTPIDAKCETTTPIQYVSGSVEAACGLGLADAVVDLVETGTTMRAAGLDVVDTLMTTETVLISNPKSRHKHLIHKLVQRVNGYLTALTYQMVVYNVPESRLAEARLITPGIQAPTIMKIGTVGWLGISALVKTKEVSTAMDKLADIGATGIIATQIANCRLRNASPFPCTTHIKVYCNDSHDP